MPDQVALLDVAREAGVSLATASRALNNSYGVSAATRARVLEVAERLQYVVSPEASRLAGGTTMRVGLVVPHIDRWFFGAMVSGLVSVLRDAGFDVLLYHVGDVQDRRRFFQTLPARRKVDALVLVALPIADSERERLELMGVRIFAAGGQDVSYPFVCIDDEAAGRQAVDHLLSLGHTRVAMIEAIDPDEPTWPLRRGRSRAYHSALEAAGLPVDESLIATGGWSAELGAEAMGQLLTQPQTPTAVYAHSDEIAVGAIRTIRRTGLRVPGDISVIGIDDHPIAALVDLTTIHQPVHEQGVRTAELVVASLEDGGPVDGAIHVPTRLIVRGTTGPPPEQRNRH